MCRSRRLYSGLFFFKQKTAYEMRISDWSSDVCSSDLQVDRLRAEHGGQFLAGRRPQRAHRDPGVAQRADDGLGILAAVVDDHQAQRLFRVLRHAGRSEEHTSELQSLMRISYAVFCLKKKTYILSLTIWIYAISHVYYLLILLLSL